MGNEDRWAKVREEIEVFSGHLASGLLTLEIQQGYDTQWSQDQYKESRGDKRYNKPGVYLIYAEDGTLLYVGSATYAFDKRVFTHSHEGARYIDFIAFEEKYSYFCLALERFLIGRLRPEANRQGVDYGAYE